MKHLVVFLLCVSTPIFAADTKPPPVDPAKQVTVVLPLQDWQAVVSSIGDSAVISARDANRIEKAIASQVQPQIAPAQAPAKKP